MNPIEGMRLRMTSSGDATGSQVWGSDHQRTLGDGLRQQRMASEPMTNDVLEAEWRRRRGPAGGYSRSRRQRRGPAGRRQTRGPTTEKRASGGLFTSRRRRGLARRRRRREPTGGERPRRARMGRRQRPGRDLVVGRRKCGRGKGRGVGFVRAVFFSNGWAD